jgi:hypothetical protein
MNLNQLPHRYCPSLLIAPVHPQVVGKSAGLPSRDLAKLAGCNEI